MEMPEVSGRGAGVRATIVANCRKERRYEGDNVAPPGNQAGTEKTKHPLKPRDGTAAISEERQPS